MQLQPGNEDPEAEQDVCEVQRERDAHGLPRLRGIRMEPEKTDEVREVRGPWLHISFEPPFQPSFRRRDVLAFISVGLTMGLSFANMGYVLLGQNRAVRWTTGVVIVCAIGQSAYYVGEVVRLRRKQKELIKNVRAFPPDIEEIFKGTIQ
jgi:hypothetical protein